MNFPTVADQWSTFISRGVAHGGDHDPFRKTVMSGYGSEKDGGYNELSKAYKKNPSIELYVKLRRAHPDAEIEVSVIGGMEQLFFMEAELKSGLLPVPWTVS